MYVYKYIYIYIYIYIWFKMKQGEIKELFQKLSCLQTKKRKY